MNESSNITVLCTMEDSNYLKIPGINIYNKQRNAYTYTGNDFIIAHPPCQQWSRLKHFAKPDQSEKDLAPFCIELIQKNGGILEHPLGSSLFKHMGIPRKDLAVIWQSWFNFPAKKPTILYVKDVELLPTPLKLDTIPSSVQQLHSSHRSRQTLELCTWLIDSVKNSPKYLEKSALIRT